MSTEPNTRTIEKELEIDAPIEAVWRALTDAEELTNWFPLEARVNPGVGGSIWTSWQNEYTFDMPIEIWEPNRHLRIIWGESGPDSTINASPPVPHPLVVDYFLETRKGNTILRLVHSGFSTDADWDEQYDGTVRGWNFELTGLRHYLELHRNVKRRVVYVRENVEGLSQERAWDLLMTALNGDSLDGVKPGDSYRLVTSAGDEFRGEVGTFQPPREFCATVENLNNAWMRADQHACSGSREMTVFISTYKVPDDQVASLQQRLGETMSQLVASERTVA